MAKRPEGDVDHDEGMGESRKCGCGVENQSLNNDEPLKDSESKVYTVQVISHTILHYLSLSISGLFNSIRHYWPMWVAGVLFLLVQWQFPLMDWWRSWDKPNSYYSHGPLVPLIALFMVWANHKRMAVIKIRPSWMGLFLIVPAIPLFVFGRWTGSGNVCAITFLMFLIGGVVMFTGIRMTKLLLFPMLYLIFMIPASATVLDSVTFKIQMASTTLAGAILNITGYAVTQVGSTIKGADLPCDLTVGVVCSGFKMMISLLTFTAFFVYMLRTPLWKKALLVAISFPLSVFVNALRIASIGYVGIWTGSSEKMYAFHDFWAMVFELVLSFAILFGIAKLIKATDFGLAEPTVTECDLAKEDSVPSYKLVGRGYRGVATIAAFIMLIVLNYTINPLEANAKGNLVRSNFPKSFGYWNSMDIQMSQIETQELKTADMMQRVYTYTMDDLPGVQVLVQAARDTDAFHDPHSCLPGNGSVIIDERIIDLKFSKPHQMMAKATLLRSVADSGEQYLLLYWYNTGPVSYATTSQVRWRMRIAQIGDIKDLVLHRTTNEEVRRRYSMRQTYCYRFTTFVQTDAKMDTQRLLRFVREFVANSKNFSD